ncbi:MAG TPA: lanthionine synthetase C family protein [Chloroflexota bacterium]
MRVTDARCLAAAVAAARQQTNYPSVFRWDPVGLADGDAGLALMCSYVDACFPSEGWDEAGHRFLSSGAYAAERTGVPVSGLFSGLTGLAFAAVSLSRNGARYQRLLTSLDEVLVPWATAQAEQLASRRVGVAVHEFDVISGVSGLAAYLLCRRSQPAAVEALRGALGALTQLAEQAEGLPRWWTPPGLLGEDMTEEFVHGNVNCGLAHGIPGPLAVLALALREEFEVPGQVVAVRRLAEWLAEHRRDDEWGVNWPAAVPVTPDGAVASTSTVPPTRTAWCYGSPGVARALWLAGDALRDADLQQLGIEAIQAVARRPAAQRFIDSPTFCHGQAGLLQVTLRFAQESRLPALRDDVDALADALVNAYQPERTVGYVSLEPGDNQVDRPGVLDGAAGVAMVLLAAATDIEPTWDRVFLLS